jgi:hypothetical protein
MLDGILSLMCCRLYSPADFGGCYPYAGVFDYSLPKLGLKISGHLQKRPAPSRGILIPPALLVVADLRLQLSGREVYDGLKCPAEKKDHSD